MATIVVIGSGFGGSIAAKRFTAAGHNVTLIEMGERWYDPSIPVGRTTPDLRKSDPAKVKQSQDSKHVMRLYRNYPHDFASLTYPTRSSTNGTFCSDQPEQPASVHVPKVIVTQGMGLGGGSLVYSGIHLRAPTAAFSSWTGGWSRTNLDYYYDRVEQRLGVGPIANGTSFPRSGVFAAGATANGWTRKSNPLAMTNCKGCGWCVPQCIYDRKNTMQHTYLFDAYETGRLSILTNYKAYMITKYGTKYRVMVWSTSGVTDSYHRVNSGTIYYVEGDQVVVSCGAVESPALLQRSLNNSIPWTGYTRIAAFPTGYLGNGVDGTGDFVQGGLVPSNYKVMGYKGAIMLNNVDRGDFVLEDVFAIPAGPALLAPCSFPAQDYNGYSMTWGLAYKQKMMNYGQRMIGIGIMGRQGAGTEGNIVVADDPAGTGNVKITSTAAYTPPAGAIAAARAMITGLGAGADIIDTPWEDYGQAMTVHPTGGCRMGGTSFAVQDTDLQVRNNPGLYVIDGSVLQTSPLRNPSHTIAAVAERAMDVILGVYGSSTWPAPPALPAWWSQCY
ncbi:MAG TPA: GMC family oxidoreductase [Kofleriaceae bacterium]|nr:GMC family oxidoreductase [Kofleriaceae bacterium]